MNENHEETSVFCESIKKVINRHIDNEPLFDDYLPYDLLMMEVKTAMIMALNERGVDQTEAAALIGIDRGTLRRFEKQCGVRVKDHKGMRS